ncbi:hypothetical protein ACQPW3_12275 [Actinosynnema sp. CA-248983]
MDKHPDHPKVSALLTGPRFLTRYDARFRPEFIENDIKITRSATDDHHRAVVVVTEYVRSAWPFPGSVWVFAGLVLVGVGLLLHRKLTAKRRAAASGGPAPTS